MGASPDPQAYVAQVMAEIEEEVRLRRSSGDLPPKLERELDELFLAHSPVAGRGGDLTEALRMVDAATFVDPVVPVDSERAAGAVVKKGMRTLLLWYVGWITHQVSQFASAVSRTLHIVEGRLKELERKVEVQRVPERRRGGGPGAAPGRRLVGRAGRRRAWRRCRAGSCTPPAVTAGWCSRIIAAGGDAYGVDPRTNLVEQGVLTVSDLRGEDLADHLRAVAPAGLGAIVLSGVVDGMASGERAQLLRPDRAPRWRRAASWSCTRSARASWDGDGRAVRGRSGPGPALAGGHLAPAPRGRAGTHATVAERAR